MLPSGFLGTRADILMDLVVVSLVAVLPLIAFSWTRARQRRYALHKRVQLTMGSILAVVVVLFEVDMRLAGGIFELTKGSRFAGTAFLNGSIYFHTFLSIVTALIWLVLLIASVRKFGSPPRPTSFGPRHRFWGRIGMVGMALTGITGIQLYVIGFAM